MLTLPNSQSEVTSDDFNTCRCLGIVTETALAVPNELVARNEVEVPTEIVIRGEFALSNSELSYKEWRMVYVEKLREEEVSKMSERTQASCRAPEPRRRVPS